VLIHKGLGAISRDKNNQKNSRGVNGSGGRVHRGVLLLGGADGVQCPVVQRVVQKHLRHGMGEYFDPIWGDVSGDGVGGQ